MRSSLWLAALVILASLGLTSSANGQVFLISSGTDGGGGISTGGGYSMLISMGEPNAGAVMIGGQWLVSPGFLNPTNSPNPASRCPADFNNDRENTADDLADFIGGYFGLPLDPRCDINRDGNIDPEDLTDFITIYFAGC